MDLPRPCVASRSFGYTRGSPTDLQPTASWSQDSPSQTVKLPNQRNPGPNVLRIWASAAPKQEQLLDSVANERDAGEIAIGQLAQPSDSRALDGLAFLQRDLEHASDIQRQLTIDRDAQTTFARVDHDTVRTQRLDDLDIRVERISVCGSARRMI